MPGVTINVTDPDVPAAQQFAGQTFWGDSLAAITAEVGAAIAMLGGRFRGAFQTNTVYSALDVVTRPSDGAMVYATTGFTSSGSYSAGNWTPLTTGSGSGPAVTAVGNLGASRADTMVTGAEKWVTGTLNAATHTVTLTLAAGARIRYFLTQDATGGRAFRLDDGSGPLAITLNTAANAVTVVDVTSPDGTNFYAEVVG